MPLSLCGDLPRHAHQPICHQHRWPETSCRHTRQPRKHTARAGTRLPRQSSGLAARCRAAGLSVLCHCLRCAWRRPQRIRSSHQRLFAGPALARPHERGRCGHSWPSFPPGRPRLGLNPKLGVGHHRTPARPYRQLHHHLWPGAGSRRALDAQTPVAAEQPAVKRAPEGHKTIRQLLVCGDVPAAGARTYAVAGRPRQALAEVSEASRRRG